MLGIGSVAVICGGVGAARFLRGAVQAVGPERVTAIVNVADDFVMHGLSISPDLDTIAYTLSNRIDPERGWGVAGETWQALGALRELAAANGSELGWFQLGDRDLGVHLYRTSRLAEGVPLSIVTAEITRAFGLDLTVLPVSDDPLRTVLDLPDGRRLDFQEYFVRHHHDVDVASVSVLGAPDASPAPGVLDALAVADAIVIAPSNPLVSIAPVLAVPGVGALIAQRREHVAAVSPIVGGKALKGPADRLMANLGHEPSALGVADLLSPLAATIVIDSVDGHHAPAIEGLGMAAIPTDTIMSTPEVTTALAATTIAAAAVGQQR